MYVRTVCILSRLVFIRRWTKTAKFDSIILLHLLEKMCFV